ncbi:MAG: cytochrome b5 domain-containing protein [Leptospirales bacterium]|nr:cytochrome b5 domain-containing protein [Leptospirales bacterium]
MVKFILMSIVIFSASVRAQDRILSLGELQSHSTAADCWTLIDQNVYDITSYLSEHASAHEYSLVKWCGKDSSAAWKDKDGKAKPHSRKAENLLRKYRIGKIASVRN